MRIIDTLRALSLYPINPLTAEAVCEECGLDPEDECTQEIRKTTGFAKSKALIYLYLAEAPQVTEAGASYNFTDAERVNLRAKARAILDEIGDGGNEGGGIVCGWVGEDL